MLENCLQLNCFQPKINLSRSKTMRRPVKKFSATDCVACDYIEYVKLYELFAKVCIKSYIGYIRKFIIPSSICIKLYTSSIV